MHLVGLGALAAVAGGWLLLVTIPFSAGLGWLVAHRIEARAPEDCWTELLVSTADDADYAGHNIP